MTTAKFRATPFNATVSRCAGELIKKSSFAMSSAFDNPSLKREQWIGFRIGSKGLCKRNRIVGVIRNRGRSIERFGDLLDGRTFRRLLPQRVFHDAVFALRTPDLLP